MKRLIVVALMSGTILAGCVMAGSIFNTEPFVDAKKDAKGNSILLDSPRMWRDFKETIGRQVSSKQASKRPPGVQSWNEHWLLVIKHMENGAQENAPKYVSYIIEQRRQAGLQELVGYP